jgi:hypothetical protein
MLIGSCYDDCMRTTLTLEGDLAERLKRIAADEGMTFKEVVNRTLREGLAARGRPKPHRTRARPLELRVGMDVRKALQLAAALEDEEIAREVQAGR